MGLGPNGTLITIIPSLGKTQRLHIVLQRKFQVGEAKRHTFVRCATANEDFVLEVLSKGMLHTEEILSDKMLFRHSRFGKSVHLYPVTGGHAVAQLVEALRYKSEGHGFDSRWCQWNFSLT